MKRKYLVLSLIMFSFLVGACGNKTESNPELEGETPTDKEEVTVKKEDITGTLTNEELTEINTYLSELSSVHFKAYNKDTKTEELLELGFWQFIFHERDAIAGERIDEAYYNTYNKQLMNEKLQRFFEYELPTVEVGDWFEKDGTLYKPENARGYSLDTVSQVERVFDKGDGTYLIEFSLYNFIPSMEEDLYPKFLLPKATWSGAWEYDLIGTGSASIEHSDKLNHYVISNYETTYLNDATTQDEEPNVGAAMGSLAYTQEEAFAKAKAQMGLTAITEGIADDENSKPTKVINDEVCYIANTEFMTAEGSPKANQVYIGSITLNVYSMNETYMLTLE